MKKLKIPCAIIKNDHGHILLIKRDKDPYKGCWALSSGVGESKNGLSPEEAVFGEVRWDLGTEFLKSTKLFSLPIYDDNLVEEVVVFAGTVDERKIKITSGHIQDFKWILPTDAAKLHNLAFEDAKIISTYLILFQKSSEQQT